MLIWLLQQQDFNYAPDHLGLTVTQTGIQRSEKPCDTSSLMHSCTTTEQPSTTASAHALKVKQNGSSRCRAANTGAFSPHLDPLHSQCTQPPSPFGPDGQRHLRTRFPTSQFLFKKQKRTWRFNFQMVKFCFFLFCVQLCILKFHNH